MKRLLKICMIALSLFCLCATSSCAANNEQPEGGFALKARVVSVGELIEVEVYDSDYAFGVYWVITAPLTTYKGADGAEIPRSDIKVGDKVEITYGGQVMQSFPPKIVARDIRVLE